MYKETCFHHQFVCFDSVTFNVKLPIHESSYSPPLALEILQLFKITHCFRVKHCNGSVHMEWYCFIPQKCKLSTSLLHLFFPHKIPVHLSKMFSLWPDIFVIKFRQFVSCFLLLLLLCLYTFLHYVTRKCTCYKSIQCPNFLVFE